MKVVHNQNENVLSLLILIQVHFLIDDILNKSNHKKQNKYIYIWIVLIITVVDGGVDDGSLERIWLSVPSRKFVNWVKSAPKEYYSNGLN